jgi:hypothetical protein
MIPTIEDRKGLIVRLLKKYSASGMRIIRPVIVIFACMFSISSWAVDCLPVDTALSSQAQVDNFQEDYGDGGVCDTVPGGLVIKEGDITNLDGLSDLVRVNTNLWFTSTSVLTNVDGLSNLTSVGTELWLQNNTALTNLDGLSGLTEVGETINIYSNAALENLDGLSGIAALKNDLSVIHNTVLTDIDGLSNISNVGNGLNIQSNPALASMGLSSLIKVVGGALIVENTALTNLAGLSNWISVGTSIRVTGNTMLDSCSGLLRLLDNVDDGEPGPGPGAGGVPDVGGDVSLINNLPGCNLIDEISTIFRSGFESPLNTITVLHDSDNSLSLGSSNSIAIGTDGTPIISYADTTLGAILVAKCENEICTSAKISTVDDPENEVGGISIAIGSDDLPVIAYHDRTAGGLIVLKCNDEACAGGDETITVVDDPENYVGTYPSIAIGVDGLPVISYRDRTAGKIKVAKCNDPSCSGGDEAISTLNATGIKTSIAIGSDGFPVISYLQDGSSPFNATVRVAKCNDSACAGEDETISIVDDASWIGFGGSAAITVAANGMPAIALYDVTDDEIRIAVCNDIACSGADETITKIDRGGGGQTLSITTGADGYPVISYHDGNFGALKVAKCLNSACSESSVSMVDSLGDSGTTTSAAIGHDDLPIISYQEAGAEALKVVHCGTTSCR